MLFIACSASHYHIGKSNVHTIIHLFYAANSLNVSVSTVANPQVFKGKRCEVTEEAQFSLEALERSTPLTLRTGTR